MTSLHGSKHPRAFRNNYLAAIGVAIFSLCSIAATAQVFPPPSTTFAGRDNRREIDSAFFFVTACGAPTDTTYLFSYGFGNAKVPKMAALYYDSCGHHGYFWDPSLKAWHRVDSSGGGGGTDSALAALYGLKIFISGTTRYIVADTNAMATRLNRDKLKDSVFGVLNASIGLKADKATTLTIGAGGSPQDLSTNRTFLSNVPNTDATNASNLSSGLVPTARFGATTVPHTAIQATAVTPGSYTSANITVAADGSVTSASNGSGGGGGLAQIFAKAPLLVSGTDTTYADTSRTSTSNSHLVTQNMVRNVHALEYVDSINTNVLQNNKLIGAKILQLQIGGITVPTIPTGADYYTFNENLGQITLQNDSFYANNHIYVLYRAPYVDSLVSTPLIGVIAYMNSFSNINFFHNNSPGNAFSISGTQIVKRNLGAIGMWSFNGDAIDYPLLNTCDEQGYFEFTYRIGSQGSGLGSGIKFGPGNNDGGSGSFNSIYANLNISSLTTPKLYIWNQQVAKDSATFPGTIAVGDSIKMRMTRNKGKFLVKATDLNTSVSVSDSITFNYTYPGNFIIPQAGRWGIAGFGSGIDTIRSLSIGSNSIVNPKVIFIGDSKQTGLYAQSQTNRFGEQVGANPLYQPFAIYADPSDRTYDALGNIEYVIQYVRPKVVFLNIGRNDGMPFSTGSKINYQNIVSRLEGYGIRVIHVLPIPEATLNQSTLSTFITSTYGTANTVDPSVGFNTGTMLAADGVHPIGTGNTVIANNIIAAMKIIY